MANHYDWLYYLYINHRKEGVVCMVDRITAEEARALSEENSRYDVILENTYYVIKRHANGGLYSSTRYLDEESKDDCERLVAQLSADGFEVSIRYKGGITNYFKKSPDYYSILIKW